MPLYEYKCSRCAWTERLIVQVQDRNNKQRCPSCRYVIMKRTTWSLKPEGWTTNNNNEVIIRKEFRKYEGPTM
jgi:putative FmdB family regulatory protein